MSTMKTIAVHRSRLALLGVTAIGLALLSVPALAADGPSGAKATSDRPTAEAKPQPKPKPRATSTRGLDDTARRALRASSSRARSEPRSSTTGERVAMLAAAPAESDGDPPKRRKSKKKPKRSTSKGDDDARAASDEDSRKISLDEDFLVEGKLEKPNAFYILRRSQSGYDWARLDAKFLPLVLESVQDPLF